VKKLYVIAGGFLAFTLLWYLMLWKPLQAREYALAAAITTAEAKTVSYQRALGELESLLDRHRELLRKESMSETVSGKEQVVAMYALLDSLGSTSNLRLLEITPSVSELIAYLRTWNSAQSALTVPVRMNLEGRYQALGQLVGVLEGQGFFRGLRHCQLNGSADLYPNCRMEITFDVNLTNRMGLFANE
jgi:hypothetical protein